jgi:hypothetical protein
MQYFLGNDYYLLTLLSCVFFVILNVVFVFFELKKAIKANFYKYFDFVYLFFAIAFVFVSRLYTFGCEVTNIDESFHIAIALDFSKSLHFWSDFDPSSVGPINTLLFYLVSIFTGEMSYFTAKVTSFIVIVLSIIFTYYALTKISKRYVVIPLLSCYAFYMVLPLSAQIVSYNSEYSLLLFFPIFLFCFVRFNESKLFQILSFGILSLIPFCKLQFAPLALFFYIYGLIKIFRIYGIKKELISTLLQIFGISLVPVIVLVVDCWRNDSFVWFYRFFFVNMVSYIDVQTSLEGYWSNLKNIFYNNLFVFTFAIVATILAIISLAQKQWKIVLFCFIILSLSLYEILKPYFPFFHYANILIIPLIYCIVILAKTIVFKFASIIVCVISILFQCSQLYLFDEQFDQKSQIVVGSNSETFWKGIALDIKNMSKPNDRLTVWGWFDELYVYSQLPSGTAEIAIGGFVPSSFINRTYNEFTAEKFKTDLIKNKPRFFIDTPSPITKIYNSYKYSVKNYKEFADLINENYHVLKQYFYPIDNVIECNFEVKNNEDNYQKGCVITLYERNE